MSSCNVRPGSLKRLNPIDRYKKRLHKSQPVPLTRLSSLLKRVSRVIIRKIIFRLSMDRVGIMRLAETPPFLGKKNRLFANKLSPSFVFRASETIVYFANQQRVTKNRILRFREATTDFSFFALAAWKIQDGRKKFEIYRRNGRSLLTRDRVLQARNSIEVGRSEIRACEIFRFGG